MSKKVLDDMLSAVGGVIPTFVEDGVEYWCTGDVLKILELYRDKVSSVGTVQLSDIEWDEPLPYTC